MAKRCFAVLAVKCCAPSPNAQDNGHMHKHVGTRLVRFKRGKTVVYDVFL